METSIAARLAAGADRWRTEFGVEALYLFGSSARGEDGAESDLDVIAVFAGGPTLRRWVRLCEALEHDFGRRVDLLTPGAIHPLIADQIWAEAIRVA